MKTHANTASPRFHKIGLILLLLLPLFITGCGQKGKLYLPDKASSHTVQQA